MQDASGELDRLIELMARLPGLGPRSARRAVLSMVKKRQTLLEPLSRALAEVAASVRECVQCGNLGTGELCEVCADPRRDGTLLCVVEDVSERVSLATDNNGIYEISVPLGVLSWRPRAGELYRADLGILRGANGQTTQRVYWANKATAITADVPSEAELTPRLWGKWRIVD